MSLDVHASRDLIELVRLEKLAFAAKMRMARAVLGISQSEFGFRVGLTQRAIHKLEQGETEPRRTTVRAIEECWRDDGVEFEETADGGFRVTVHAALIARSNVSSSRRRRAARTFLGVTAMAPRPSAYRA